MSIYATMWSIHVSEASYCDAWNPGADECECVEVYAQGVPGHIDYTGADWEWLPPPVASPDLFRAVFVCGPETRKGTERNGQEYENHLFMMTGEEYQAVTWDEMLSRIESALHAANSPSALRREIRRAQSVNGVAKRP